jgi:tRNA dimethylallyltransferase
VTSGYTCAALLPHSVLSTQHSALLVIAGPTGAGKSDFALRLAEAANGEILNYDSVQIYRGFDVGSAKPAAEVRARVPHHLFDIVDAGEEFNAADFARAARQTCDAIVARGRRPILVGGTFFYLRAFLRGLPEMPGRDADTRARIRRIAERPRGAERLHRWLSKIDPQSGRRIAPADRHRVERALEVWLVSGRPISSFERGDDEIPNIKIALSLPRPRLHEAIDRRVDAMYGSGLVEETRRLLETYSKDARPFGTIGYREAVAVIDGTMALDAAIAETKRRTRAYAKRQLTWLGAERNVHWLEAGNPTTFAAAMELI